MKWVALVLAVIPFVLLKADDPLEEKMMMTYPLDRVGNLGVTNIDGSIRIYGWNRSEVQIEATKKAYVEERLRKIAVNVTAKADNVIVDTYVPPRKGFLADRSGTVDYVILAPATVRVQKLKLVNGEIGIDGMRGSVSAELLNGRITTRNCFANLELSLVNGGMDFIYSWWEKQRFSVHAVITNGDMRVVMPAEASFQYLTRTLSGEINNQFNPRRNDDETTDARKAAGTVGSGGAVFDLVVTHGAISIQRP